MDKRFIRTVLFGLTLLALSACAHEDLTAPCDATDNGGLFGWLERSGRAFACEPMRRIGATNAGDADGVH